MSDIAAPLPTAVIAHLAGLRFFTDEHLEQLAEVATLLDPEPISRWDDPRADDLLSRAQVIVGHWGCPPIDAAVLDRAPNLGLFAYAAGTVKGVIDGTIFERGVRVTSGALANAEPVAEFALAAILFAAKDVFWSRDLQRDLGLLTFRPRSDVAVGNWGKTVGIIGASMVGRRVIELLRSFPHLAVDLYDPFVSAAEAAALGVRKVELDALCATADIVSIHAPDLPATQGMVGAAQLASMRTGATLINTARPALVDQDALIAELRTGRLYAVLDVTKPEPLPLDHELRTLPTVFLTPHLAGSAGAELGRLAAYAADEIHRWSHGEPARNEVHADQLDRLA